MSACKIPDGMVPLLRVRQKRGDTVWASQQFVYSTAFMYLVAMRMDSALLREAGFVDPEREWTCELVDFASLGNG